MSSMTTLEMQSSHVFWRLCRLKFKNFIMEHDILGVSKSVALYQKYVHIKNSLAMGYITRAGRQVKMMFIPVPEANYTQLRHTVLIDFFLSCRKQYKKLWPGISGKSHCGMSHISKPICLKTREVHRICNAPCVYTYTGRSRKKRNYIGVFLDYEGPYDSTSRDITKVAKWHRL